MDNLTHSLVGLFLARAGLNRWSAGATAIGVVAANAPDIDVVSLVAGKAALLHWHRNFSHSIAFSPVLAIATVALIRLIIRKPVAWGPAFLVAWVAVASHLLIDLTNQYGVRLLEPFSPRWIEWDVTAVIDPYIWAVLLLAFFAPLLARLLSSEIGGRKRAYPSRAWPIFALGIFLLFDCARAVLHARSLDTLNSRLFSGEAPRDVASFPTALNPLAWQGLVSLSNRYMLYNVDLSAQFDPASGITFFRNSPGAAVGLLRKQPEFESLYEFVQYPLWRVITEGNNSRITLTDLRFGNPTTKTFSCWARVIQMASVTDQHCDFTFSPAFPSD